MSQGSLFDDEGPPPILCFYCRQPIEWQETERRWMHTQTRQSRCADGEHFATAPTGGSEEFSFDPHTHSRRDDPDTSDHAAKRVRPDSHIAKLARVYGDAGDAGLTPQEAGMKAGVREEAAHKRVSDLKNLGWIETVEVNGQKLTRPNPGTREDAEVLRITNLGYNALQRLGR
jgi:hypothetical protein